MMEQRQMSKHVNYSTKWQDRHCELGLCMSLIHSLSFSVVGKKRHKQMKERRTAKVKKDKGKNRNGSKVRNYTNLSLWQKACSQATTIANSCAIMSHTTCEVPMQGITHTYFFFYDAFGKVTSAWQLHSNDIVWEKQRGIENRNPEANG